MKGPFLLALMGAFILGAYNAQTDLLEGFLMMGLAWTGIELFLVS